MKRAAGVTALGVCGLIFVPYGVSFVKVFAGFLVVTLGLLAVHASLNDDPAKARSNLMAALGMIVLIEALAPLDWRALFG